MLECHACSQLQLTSRHTNCQQQLNMPWHNLATTLLLLLLS
jgi:hypothetical protein